MRPIPSRIYKTGPPASVGIRTLVARRNMLRLELEAEVEGHDARASVTCRLTELLVIGSEARDVQWIRVGTARGGLVVAEDGTKRCCRIPSVELRVIEHVVCLDLYLERAPLVLADRYALLKCPIEVV